jgi:antitoxin MazE
MNMSTKAKKLKIIQIGNSRGIRLPKGLLEKYGFTEIIQVEELEDGLLLKSNDQKLSWKDTFKQMSRENEDWSDMETTISDGIEIDDYDTETI